VSWSAPQWTWVFLVPVALAFALRWAEARRRERLERLIAARLAARLVRGAAEGKRRAGAVLVVSAAVFLAAALVRPTWGFHWEEVPAKGRDLYVLLDISKSMLAQDVSPDRLTWAKRKVIDLAALVPGDRIGVIAFSAAAFLACPLTADSEALSLILDSLSPESTTGGGTAISSALDLAVERLTKKRSGESAVLLLTDGEDHDGGAQAAAKRAAKAGVAVYALGVGRPDGAPIPEPQGGFKKTASGEMVLTRLDEAALQELARAGEGAYQRSQPGDGDLQAILSRLSGDEADREAQNGRRQVPDERFQWPLLLAVFLLLAEALVQDGLPRLSRKWAAAALLFLFAPAARGADLKQLYESGQYEELEKRLLDRQVRSPEDADLLYDLGNTLYRQKKFAEAEKAFAAAAEKSQGPAKERAVYNRGNAAFRQNRLEDAIGHYETAVALDPKDEDARHNLAVAKRRLEEQKKQQQQNQNQQNQDKDSGKQEKQGDANQDDKAAEKDKAQDKRKPEEAGAGKEEKKEQSAQNEPGKENMPEPASEAKEGDKGEPKGAMSKEEAQAWLSRVREMKAAKRGQPKNGGTPGGKDW
jgi:Ca-activated chloride channel homolog